MCTARRLVSPLAVLILLAAMPTARAAMNVTTARQQLAGMWRGMSLCVHSQRNAACNDEEVVYEFTPAEAQDDGEAMMLRADKMVDGKRLHMYTARFVYDTLRERWTSEVHTARANALWSYVVTGDSVKGMLQDMKTHDVLRHVELKRAR